MEGLSDPRPPDGDTNPPEYAEDRYHYTRTFRPKLPQPPKRGEALRGGDRAGATPYSYDEEIILAVNTALAANRPLLVAGPPGTGKSALAADIARQLDHDPGFEGHVGFVQQTITGRTEGRDLLWRFDTVKRLRDAHLAATRAAEGEPGADRDPLAPENYLSKGVLWTAFEASHRKERMVVLIDEIDKADPDVPNSLLDVLGSGRFHIDEIDREMTVKDDYPPFIVITTNDERELSRPFRRRCVTLALPAPSAERLLDIATAQGLATETPKPPTDDAEAVTKPSDRELAWQLAEKIEELGGTDAEPGELMPNAAEYLDALRACQKLGVVDFESIEWKAIKEATLVKSLRRDRKG